MDRTEILLDHIKAHVENDRKLLAAYSELLQVATDYCEDHYDAKHVKSGICDCDLDQRCWGCRFNEALNGIDREIKRTRSAMPLAVGA